MRKGSMQKLKYVIILEILRRETDSEHTMPTKVLLQKLSEYGIESSRETLYSDIKVLNENGFEILCNRGISNEYFVEDRNFDLPELKILMDAVQATSFITPKKTDELIDKIASLGGSHRAELLKNDTVIYNTIKHTNEHIYYSINEIALAISNNRKIVFKYFDYSETKERVYRKEGKNFCLNPIALMINNDNYYLVGYNDYFKKILHYIATFITEMAEVNIERAVKYWKWVMDTFTAEIINSAKKEPENEYDYEPAGRILYLMVAEYPTKEVMDIIRDDKYFKYIFIDMDWEKHGTTTMGNTLSNVYLYDSFDLMKKCYEAFIKYQKDKYTNRDLKEIWDTFLVFFEWKEDGQETLDYIRAEMSRRGDFGKVILRFVDKVEAKHKEDLEYESDEDDE